MIHMLQMIFCQKTNTLGHNQLSFFGERNGVVCSSNIPIVYTMYPVVVAQRAAVLNIRNSCR